jgi:hypothetical protein
VTRIAATVIGAASVGLGIATPTHDALIDLIAARRPIGEPPT